MGKLFRLVFAVAVLSFCSWTNSAAEEIRQGASGFYYEKVPIAAEMGILVYYADTGAQLCYMMQTATILIPCESLAKRPGWKSIITWAGK